MSRKSDKLPPTALIVDDEQSICESLAGVLSDEGWKSTIAFSGKQALIEFKLSRPDIVFLDVWMPGMDGIETLQQLKKMRDDVPVVIMSGHGTIDTAVRTTKLGAYDFLEKPLSLDKIIPILEHSLKGRSQTAGVKGAKLPQLIGTSSSVEMIRQQIKKVAPRNSSVLITGENGTGKEVVARNIHEASTRSEKPFIAVNCAAIPEELIESELFGHVKGAFTNAISNKRGKFELADKGTLFLDEIGDMSLRTQAKILRILQEKQFEQVGGGQTIDVDVRIIAATNKKLEDEIGAGNFREDLYYRLNVIPFQLQPLRERTEDIPLLIDFFLEQMSIELGEEKKRFSTEAMGIITAYRWSGNVRELRNLLERLTIMVPSVDIEGKDLPQHLPSGVEATSSEGAATAAASLKEAKSDFERAYILDKLQENQWNVTKTAEAIGIERSNLHRKLRAYKIDTKKLKG